MPRNKLSTIETQLVTAKEKAKSIDQMKANQLRNMRSLVLKAHESGMSQTAISRIMGTNATRIKVLINQAQAERFTNENF